MTNPFEAFPLYLTPRDIMDATQYSKPVVYQMIKEMEKFPGMVVRRPSARGIRIHRDKFFPWFMERENMTVPEGLKGA